MSSVARAFATERFRRSPAQRQLTVLHIDDDPNDTTLLQAATRRAGLNLALKNLEDFEHAIAYLGGHGSYSDRSVYPLPKLILLDLKMPRATGFEVLRWIRGTPGVSNIPVIVLSGSELQEDVRRAYVGGANSYLVKPLGFEALVELVRNIHTVWLTASQQGAFTARAQAQHRGGTGAAQCGN
jgi:CheY-like chemotaxis protein